MGKAFSMIDVGLVGDRDTSSPLFEWGNFHTFCLKQLKFLDNNLFQYPLYYINMTFCFISSGGATVRIYNWGVGVAGGDKSSTKHLGGPCPWEIWKSRVPEIPFLAFCLTCNHELPSGEFLVCHSEVPVPYQHIKIQPFAVSFESSTWNFRYLGFWKISRGSMSWYPLAGPRIHPCHLNTCMHVPPPTFL